MEPGARRYQRQRQRLVGGLVLLVCLPTGLLGWLGLRVIGAEHELVQQRLERLLLAQLEGVDQAIARLLARRAQHFLELLDVKNQSPEVFRQLVRNEPMIDNLFVQTKAGQLVHPPVGGSLSEEERRFVTRTRRIFVERLLLTATPSEHYDQRLQPQSQQPSSVQSLNRKVAQVQQAEKTAIIEYGWYSWYWESGLHLLFWRREGDGDTIGVELSRARLLADLIEELSSPDSAPTLPLPGLIVLADSRQRVLMHWGALALKDRRDPQVERGVSPPFGTWTLRYYLEGELQAGAAGSSVVGVAAFVVVAAALIGLSVFLYRESMREALEAAQRVRFVNQVSHELRTPLTNIRLYAELLERRLELEEDPTAGEQLAVIISECHRLSRLVDNVLTFARHHRGSLTISPRQGCVDETIRGVLDQFSPTLSSRGILVELDLDASTPFSFDADALEQILANLLSNVEKYAASGEQVKLSSHQHHATCTITVCDRGPGIPAGKHEAVFEPFTRLSDQLTEGVSGAGIGLGIARELARQHGGELSLVPVAQGARFELTLPMDKGATL